LRHQIIFKNIFSMKKDAIIYWATTGLIGAMMLVSAYLYLLNPMFAEKFKGLGFPDWFRAELGVAKFLGAVALLVPAVPVRFKTWAYVGFGIMFASAGVLHFSNGDGVSAVATPLVLLGILAVSGIYLSKVGKVAV